MRILCLDIEGGYGGSSRSLFASIRHMPADVACEVWCRRDGPVQVRYRDIGVACHVTADMPHFSALPNFSRNVYGLVRFAQAWRQSRRFRESLADEVRGNFDAVHFNHEGLFWLARWLRRRLGASMPMTMHIRTHLPSTLFSRWQFRSIAGTLDRLVFITENEAARVELLAGGPVPGDVIYNAVSPPAGLPDADLASDRRFKVAAIANYAYIRGLDRLMDVAAELKRRGRTDILFVMAGRMILAGSLPGDLGKVGRAGGDLAHYARVRGVDEMFRFLGHVPEPERVTLACDVIVKPTREHNPWGRDIIEAMAAAKPVMTLGRYDRFVENGVTGILHHEFDARAWADEIVRLSADRDLLARLGAAGRERVLTLCDGHARAGDLRNVWAAAILKREVSCAA